MDVGGVAKLRVVAQQVVGPDDLVKGAFICTKRRSGIVALVGVLLGPLATVVGFGAIGWRAVAVTDTGVVLLGKFSWKGYPTAVLGRLALGTIERPDELAGDPTVVVGGEKYFVVGEHLDEARRVSRLKR